MKSSRVKELFGISGQITLCCATGFAMVGYDDGLFSGILVNPNFLSTFHHPGSTLTGHIAATFNLGSFVGAVITSLIGEKLGRRKVLLAGSVIHIIGGILQASSFQVVQLIFGRAIAGIGCGFLSSIVPVWQAETASAKYRGKKLVIQLALVDLGIVVVNWINYGFRNSVNSVSWRFPVALQIIFPITTFAMVCYLPESPRWLVYQNRNDEAEIVFSKLLAEPVGSEAVTQMKLEVMASVEHEKKLRSSMKYSDLFRRDRLQSLRRIVTGVSAQVFQQFSGINMVLYYLPTILENSAHMSHSMALILSACNSMNLAFFTLFSLFTIDRFGRRLTMFVGLLLQGVCFIIVTIGLAIGTRETQFMAVAFMFFYNTVFSIGVNATPWCYPAEINTQVYRNLGGSLATAGNWISNYCVVLVTPDGIANLNWRYYIIYTVLNFAFAPIVFFFYVETAQLTLEQIDDKFLQLSEKKYGPADLLRENSITKEQFKEPGHVEVSDDVSDSVNGSGNAV
jgi:sugar porter (SP) family MFS transporter